MSFLYACLFSDGTSLEIVARGYRALIRVFVFDDMRYLNFDAEMSLRKVKVEVEKIKSVLLQELDLENYQTARVGPGIIYPTVPTGGLERIE